VLKRLQGGISFGGPSATIVVGEPDRIVFRTTGELLLAIELKTPSTPRSDNLVRLYEQDLALSMANFAPNSSSTHVIQQIHGYLCVNRLRYGVLTTYNQTWLLKRLGNGLEVSRVINTDDQDPSVLRSLSYILKLALEHASEPSPVPSPSNSPRQPAGSGTSTEDDDDDDRDYHPATYFGSETPYINL
jgi:hypothetical protein